MKLYRPLKLYHFPKIFSLSIAKDNGKTKKYWTGDVAFSLLKDGHVFDPFIVG